MSEQIIKLSDNAVNRIKEILSNAENNTIGVRIGVKSGLRGHVLHYGICQRSKTK